MCLGCFVVDLLVAMRAAAWADSSGHSKVDNSVESKVDLKALDLVYSTDRPQASLRVSWKVLMTVLMRAVTKAWLL